MPSYPTQLATSAGGVVYDDRADGRRWVLLIALRNAAGRPQWTLPKGGIEQGESSEIAALREVREETGYGASIVGPLGTIDYWFIWRPDAIRYHKFVHYFLMAWDGLPPVERDDEAEHVEWVPLDAALIRLAHRNERDLVRLADDALAADRQPLTEVPTTVDTPPSAIPIADELGRR